VSDEFERLLADAQQAKAERDTTADAAARKLAEQIAQERRRARDLIPQLNKAVARLQEVDTNWSGGTTSALASRGTTTALASHNWAKGELRATLGKMIHQPPGLPALPPKPGLFRRRPQPQPPPPPPPPPPVRYWTIRTNSSRPRKPGWSGSVDTSANFAIPESGQMTIEITLFTGSTLEEAAAATLVTGTLTWPGEGGYGGGSQQIEVHVVGAFQAALATIASYIADVGG
jgi:hypothetical protein